MGTTYLEHMKMRLAGQESHVPSSLGAKPKVRQFAEMIGIRTPEIYYEGPLESIPWEKLPERFVFKPAFATTSIGVFLVETGEDRKWRDSVTKKPITKEMIIEKSLAVIDRYSSIKTKREFIVEQLLVSHSGLVPPPDVRVNAFFGELGMIYLDDHLSGDISFSSYFDGSFKPFDDIEARYAIAEKAKHRQEIVQAEPTPNADLIIKIAKRISWALPTAFSRIDLYDTPDGVFLGEITFYPGAFYYEDVKLMLPVENERLGGMWDSAIERLREYEVRNLR